jgi:hypothetical protein
MWYEGRLDFDEKVVDGFLETAFFGLRFLRHVGVVGTSELAGFRELLLVSIEPGPHLHQWLEVAELPPQRSHSLPVSYVLRIGELSLYLRGPLDRVPEPVAETQVSVLGAAAAGLPYF